MKFLNLNFIFWNQNEEYTFYQKLCQTKFVDLIATNNFAKDNFANLHFFVFHILLKNWILDIKYFFFKLKIKIYILWKNVVIQICRSFSSKQFCIIIFFRISYNLTEKWNLDIDFFQVLTYCNFPNFSLVEKKPVLEFLIFSKTQIMLLFWQFLLDVRWLTNLSLLFRLR